MNVEFKIDWIQFTALPTMPIVNRFWHEGESTKSFMPFYKKMKIWDDILSLHYDNPVSPRVLIVATGKACAKIGIDHEFCARIIKEQATVSRIDLCLTTDFNFLPLIPQSVDKIESHMFRDIKIISDERYTPQTIYIGDFEKRGKNGIVRAYDKGLQLGLPELNQFRLEYESKRKHADITAKRLASGETIADCMNAKFRIDSQWYVDMLGNGMSTKRFDTVDSDTVSEIQKKMLWIEKQVIPSLQYVLDYDKINGTNNFESIINKLKFT